jgi:hypothetical protein
MTPPHFTLTVPVKVASLGSLRGPAAFAPLPVDPGSYRTWFPAAALRRLGIVVEKPAVTFVTPDGREMLRDVGFAFFRCGPFETVDEVVFAGEFDTPRLGARTLIGFGARLDRHGQGLVPAAPHPVATGAISALYGPVVRV